jgi:hypothetical protein
MKVEICIIGALVVFCGGCVNPFAPELRGPTGSLWSDASTIGGLLENFKTAYELGDSLQYAECLDESFQFQYFDAELNRTESWFRETDLRATARLFRSFRHINLIWGQAPPGIEEIATPDSLVEFQIPFQLLLDEVSPVIGFAHFIVNKPANDRFRIVLWQDDF